MRVLITGGCGFVGGHLVDFLLEHTDWELVVLDASVERQVTRAGARLITLKHDLGARISPVLDHVMGDVTAVVHLAAASDVSDFMAAPGPLVRNNVDVTLNLLEWARTKELTHFIQVSTNEVYGPVGAGEPQVEWAAIVPPTPYSASKAAQEALAVAWWRSYGVPVTIVNMMHLFGEGQLLARFIPSAVRRLRAGTRVPVYAGSVAGHWVPSSRCWLYVKDLAGALHWLLSRPSTQWPDAARPDRWNIAGPEISLSRLVDLIADLLDVEPLIAWVDVEGVRPGHEHRYALDTSKITRAGWKPHYGFDEGLNRTVTWMVDHEA